MTGVVVTSQGSRRTPDPWSLSFFAFALSPLGWIRFEDEDDDEDEQGL
jgi:hypothetical protein